MGQADKPVTIENWNDIRELALMSIGTDKGSWWADPDFGSELYLLRQGGKADGRAAGALRRMLLECTRWMVTDGLAAKIECEADRSGKNEITYCVTVYRKDGFREEIREAWSAV